MVSLDTIYNWFKSKSKPTGTQFRATWDSFWHKSERIPVQQIEGIDDLLNDQADADLLNAHMADDDRHVTDNLLQEIDNKPNKSDLHAVATSGSYYDLIDYPTFTNDGNATKIVRSITASENSAEPNIDELEDVAKVGDTAEVSYADQIVEHWAYTTNGWQLKFAVDYTKKTNTSELINDGDGTSVYITDESASQTYLPQGNYSGSAEDLQEEINRIDSEKATVVDVEDHTYNQDIHVTQALRDEIAGKTDDITLHKVAKTGDYRDLVNVPTFEQDANSTKIVRVEASGSQVAPTAAEVGNEPTIGDTAEVSYTNQVVEHWAYTNNGWELKFAVDFAKNKNTSQLTNDGDGSSPYVTTHNAANTYLPKGNYLYDAATLKSDIDTKADTAALDTHAADDQRHVTSALRQEIANKTNDASLHKVAKTGSYKDLIDVPVFTNDGSTSFVARNYDGRTNEAFKRNAPTVSDVSNAILGDTAIISYKDAISAHWSYTDEGTWAYKFAVDEVQKTKLSDFENDGDGSSPFITNTDIQQIIEENKMPITFKKAYVNIYFVSVEDGDNNTAKPNSYQFYSSIVAASEAARSDYDATGNQNIVYVLKGAYKEENVNREYVDLYFEDGTVVWTDTESGSVINDVLEPINNADVYGKGTFVNKVNNPGVDGEGINFRKESNVYIEAKLIDSIQVWNPDKSSVKLVNTQIIYGFFSHQNKSFEFINCTFLNGCQLPKYRTVDCSYIFKDCNFYLQPYPIYDARNSSSEIYDIFGNLLFRVVSKIEGDEGVIGSLDTEGKSHEEILSEFHHVYSKDQQVSRHLPLVACFTDIDPNHGWLGFGKVNVEVHNSQFIIKKENCLGIVLNKLQNGISTSEGYRVFNNITIIDETNTKNTIAIASGWGDRATKQPELGINSISHNCKLDSFRILPQLNVWQHTFKNLPNKVAAENIVGQVSEENLPELPNTALSVYGVDNKPRKDLTVGVRLANSIGDFSVLDGKDVFFAKNINDIPEAGYTFNYTYILLKKELFERLFGLGNFYLGSQKSISSDVNGVSYNNYIITVGNETTQYKIHVTPNFNAIPNEKGYIRLIARAIQTTNSTSLIQDYLITNGEHTDIDLVDCSIYAQPYSFNKNTIIDASTFSGRKATDFVQYEHITAKTLKKGWYTIAINYGNRASAKFILRDTRSAYHQSVHFYAAHHYGNGNVITVLSNSFHANNGAIRYLRLKEGGIYDGVMLQAYIDVDDAPVQGWILEDIQSNGWSARNWIPDGTDPGGLKNYSALTNIAAQVDLDYTMGVNSSQPIYSENKKVLTEGIDLDLTNNEIKWSENSDVASIGFKNDSDSDSDSYMYFKTGDNGNEYFKWFHKYPSSVGGTQEEWMQLKSGALKIKGDIHANGTFLYGDNKQIIKFDDSWLRLNPSGGFSHGIYCGNKILRTDGEFEVGPSGSRMKVAANGDTTVSGNIVAAGNISGASDIKLKKDIQPLDLSVLERVENLQAKTYRWKDITKDQSQQLGFIAQEVEEIFPEWVTEVNDTKAISYDKMGAVLAVEGIKQMKLEISLLRAQINELKAVINAKDI